MFVNSSSDMNWNWVGNWNGNWSGHSNRVWCWYRYTYKKKFSIKVMSYMINLNFTPCKLYDVLLLHKSMILPHHIIVLMILTDRSIYCNWYWVGNWNSNWSVNWDGNSSFHCNWVRSWDRYCYWTIYWYWYCKII